MKRLALLLLPLLVACTENYRYPCQDPDNWDKQICQKPWCSANGTCPEDLKHYEKDKAGQVMIPQTSLQNQASSKGDCK
jgi:hypothetical protein